MDIEVTVTLANLEEIQAQLDKIIEEAQRETASGEIIPGFLDQAERSSRPIEPEVEPCDCVGCSPHLGPPIPCERETDGTAEG